MRPLVVMALPEESLGLVEKTGVNVLYTGVGKVNATYTLTRALGQMLREGAELPLVLNLGSAGSPVFPTGSLVASHRFVQRDMDATGLGFAPGETPFDTTPVLLECPLVFPALSHGVCGSGDSFLQGSSLVPCEIIDMEAYALARVCHRETAPFACVKYITDDADAESHKDWQQNLRLAAEAFAALCEQLVMEYQ